jgi:hypothetical protein
VLSFIEHFRGVKAGDRVLQIAFGSGFKCNSAVWVANRTIREETYAWEVSPAAAVVAALSCASKEWTVVGCQYGWRSCD